jgi:hypothetical protein
MFAGMFFLTLGAGGSYLGFIRREAVAPAAVSLTKAERPLAPPAPLPQLVESSR